MQKQRSVQRWSPQRLWRSLTGIAFTVLLCELLYLAVQSWLSVFRFSRFFNVYTCVTFLLLASFSALLGGQKVSKVLEQHRRQLLSHELDLERGSMQDQDGSRPGDVSALLTAPSLPLRPAALGQGEGHIKMTSQGAFHLPGAFQTSPATAERLETFGIFLPSMVHELKTTLASLSLFTQNLPQQCTLPDQALQRLTLIEQQIDYSLQLMKNLQAIVSSPPDASELQQIDVNEVIRAALMQQKPLLTFYNIDVALDLPSTLPGIASDRDYLQQVFLNLFSNAIYAMQRAHGCGTLTIRSFRNGPEVCVEVCDDGPGILPEAMGRIFQPSFTTKRADGGSGLGLSLARGIVETYGGKIRADNLPASGGRFTVSFPLDAGGAPDSWQYC